MHFLLAGVSHNIATVERLQRLAISRRALPEILGQGALVLGDLVIISTCNRTELYTSAPDPATGHRRLLDYLKVIDRRQELDAGPLEPYVYALSDDEAIRHLFRVTAGLDALVLGEPEIAGQVSHALRAAGEAGVVSSPLSRLFHHALRAGRKVRRNTAIGQGRVSVSSIGVDLLERSTGSLEGLRVLVIGAGQTGLQAARALRRSGVSDLIVSSRNAAHAVELAADLGGSAAPLDAVPGLLATVDAVVTCTGAEAPIIAAATVETAMQGRSGRPLFILDLALPPDVEREAGEVPGVSLYGLEALAGIAKEHRAERVDAVQEAESIIDGEVEHFKELMVGAESEPLIRALGERAEAVRNREVARSLARLQSLGDDELEVIDAMTRAIVSKLLADPISFLREMDDQESATTVAKAFDLPEGLTGEPAGDLEDGQL